MAERGRKPGWSLLLNPTPDVLADLGYPSAESLRRPYAPKNASHARNTPARHLDTPGHEPEL
jgi:hypothetical protein